MAPAARWLLLIYQLPAKPAYLRVKVNRRLARVGAVALKHAVYVLPNTPQAREDFQWLRREVVVDGGDATLLDAAIVDGTTDADVEALFNAARDEDYRALVAPLAALSAIAGNAPEHDAASIELASGLRPIEQRVSEIERVDFFDAPQGALVRARVRELRAALRPLAIESESTPSLMARGITWVTRADVGIDRVASAWLVQRFIDAAPTFKFVDGDAYAPREGEQRFDMFEAEHSHEGDRCTFEVLLDRFALRSAGLREIAEVVHDLDLKDGRFGRDEAAGVRAQLAGIRALHREDIERVRAAGAMFDALLAHFAERAARTELDR